MTIPNTCPGCGEWLPEDPVDADSHVGYCSWQCRAICAEDREMLAEETLRKSERMRRFANARLGRLDPEVDRLRDEVALLKGELS